ncbi:hypothetical protein CIHG_03793 [Coccidioides immitis H538.4]|uniref:Uncharacterized protein n=3 Tax=Coccidioides immitis TaxID=5501 RepID=A0A0J8R0G5_COCIT|nr:hypothetical protein CIRG_04974 [Coccidioides immitis RMSCC 2394]KMU77825.1 hypothetical protein CISG_01581 [Coccidioides immitis RMSCC 3703]KMU85753.1 hypothetical protein CIHG_03793 [Coccidioides immitis H538.4]
MTQPPVRRNLNQKDPLYASVECRECDDDAVVRSSSPSYIIAEDVTWMLRGANALPHLHAEKRSIDHLFGAEPLCGLIHIGKTMTSPGLEPRTLDDPIVRTGKSRGGGGGLGKLGGWGKMDPDSARVMPITRPLIGWECRWANQRTPNSLT